MAAPRTSRSAQAQLGSAAFWVLMGAGEAWAGFHPIAVVAAWVAAAVHIVLAVIVLRRRARVGAVPPQP